MSIDWLRNGNWIHTPDHAWQISRSDLYGGEKIYNAWDWYGGPLPEIIATHDNAEDCKRAIEYARDGD